MAKHKLLIGIYKITSPSGRIYIGQSTNILKRFAHYKILKCKRQTKLYASLLKHGAESHSFEIVELCEQSCLDALEIKYIDQYKSFNTELGLNLKAGGAYGTHSDETKMKIGLVHKGKVVSQQARDNMSKGQRKIKDWKSKHASEWQKGRILTDEHKKNIGKAHIGNQYMKGRKLSDETKLKIGNIHKGNKYNLGRKKSDVEKERISFMHKGKPKSREQRKKMSDARRAWNAKPKEGQLSLW